MGIQVGGKIFSNNNTLNLPERTGTLADQQYVDEAVAANSGNGSSSIILTSPDNSQWSITIDDNGQLIRTKL